MSIWSPIEWCVYFRIFLNEFCVIQYR
jgi:hypothetical protein